MVANVTNNHATCVVSPYKQAFIEKTKDLREIELLLIANHIFSVLFVYGLSLAHN